MCESKYMKRQFVCIAGKNDIAVDILEYLIEKNGEYNIGIICNKTETGENSFQKSLRWFGNKHKIREYTLAEIYDIDNLILLSLEFDRILKPNMFKDARLYNIHFSLLPKYKGMFTAVLPILNGEHESGVTLHRIDSGIDTGEIIDQVSFPINELDCRELYLTCIEHGTRVVIRNIDAILNGCEVAYSQGNTDSTYYSKKSINFNEINIDLNQTANVIANQIRAFCFREYQLPKINGHFIIDYRFTDTKSDSKPGQVIWDTNNICMIATIDYNLILYYDRFDELLENCKTGGINTVCRICGIKKYLNASDRHGWTPLMVATYNNQIEVVEFLLSQGADVNAVNNNGTTLLMYAKEAYTRTGDSTIFSLLLKFGANTSLRDYSGKSLNDYCREEGITKIGDYEVD